MKILKKERFHRLPLLFLCLSISQSSPAETETNSPISKKVQILAEAIRLRDQGQSREALSRLQDYLKKHPNDAMIRDRVNRLQQNLGSGEDSPSVKSNSETLLEEVIEQKERTRQDVEKAMKTLQENGNALDMDEFESELQRMKTLMEPLNVGVELKSRFLNLERRYRLRRAEQLLDRAQLEAAEECPAPLGSWIRSFKFGVFAAARSPPRQGNGAHLRIRGCRTRC